MFKTPKVGPAKRTSRDTRGSTQMGVSQELMIKLDSDLSGLCIYEPLQGSSSKEGSDAGGSSRLPQVPQNSWSCSIIGLLCICAILFLLLVLMNLKVARLEKWTTDEAAMWRWKILTLTEILGDLQIGKVLHCSICKIQWLQRSKKCYLFQNRKMNWHSSQNFCLEENAELTVFTTKNEMFLRFHASGHYYLDPKTYQYDKFWIGLMYDVVESKWLWLDGTAFQPTRHETLGDRGCAYLQNKSLHSQPCTEVAKSICETKVQFGWSL